MPSSPSDPAKAPLEVSVRRIHRRDLNRTWEFLKLVLPRREPRDGRVPAPALEARGSSRSTTRRTSSSCSSRSATRSSATPSARWTRAATTAGSTCATSRSAACARCSSRSSPRTPTITGAASARFMLEQLQHLARVRGCTHLVLEVAENNEDALRWYRTPQLLQARRGDLPRAEGRDRAGAAAAPADRVARAAEAEGDQGVSAGVEREVAAIREAGFVVLPDLIPPGDLAEMRRALTPALDAELYGRNDFEGHRTQRVYSLVARGARVRGARRAPARPGAVRRVPRAQLPAHRVAGDRHPARRDAAAVPHRRRVLPHRAAARRPSA